MNSSERPTFSDMSNLLRHVQWPVMPEVGQALVRTLNDEEADIEQICNIISRDPTLTATLLRMANSAMFGLSGTVDTLERAISVVGLSLVRARALSICIVNSVSMPSGLDRLTFWKYCLLCAGYAQWLAKPCGVNEHEAWLCGLLLRMGEINLGQASPKTLALVEAKPISPGERWTRQRALIGFDEGEVTAELLKHWDFPVTLVEGLRRTAQPMRDNEFLRLSAVVHVAGRLADVGVITPESLTDLPVILVQLLQLDVVQLFDAAPDAHSLADVTMFLS